MIGPICTFSWKGSPTTKPVFARYGFAGATTKKLAKAAGVSKALLYKYFTSKEAIYQEILLLLPKRGDSAFERVDALKPSTESLICWTHVFAHRLLFLNGSEQQEHLRDMHRLVLNSQNKRSEHIFGHCCNQLAFTNLFYSQPQRGLYRHVISVLGFAETCRTLPIRARPNAFGAVAVSAAA